MTPMVVSMFPCMGKTTIATQCPNYYLDLDSSNFNKNNEGWYKDYISVATDLARTSNKCVFVSSHLVVREEMYRQSQYNADIIYVSVFPEFSEQNQEELIARAMRRLEEDKSPKNDRAYRALAEGASTMIISAKNDKLPYHLCLKNIPGFVDLIDILENYRKLVLDVQDGQKQLELRRGDYGFGE